RPGEPAVLPRRRLPLCADRAAAALGAMAALWLRGLAPAALRGLRHRPDPRGAGDLLVDRLVDPDLHDAPRPAGRPRTLSEALCLFLDAVAGADDAAAA